MKHKLKFKHFITLFAIIIVYYLLRLQNIESIPVFGDEAIYLRWSQLIKNVETLRFVPVSDGKQPFFMWLTAFAFKYFSDPLITGRLVSIIVGSLTVVCIYCFSNIFYNYQIALISSILYLLLPFTFFFDRLALPDNLLSFFGFVTFFLSLILSKAPRLDLSMILGIFLGLAWLTKSPAIYFIILSIITFFTYSNKNIFKFYFPLISSIFALIIYNILRLGPQFHQIALRNKDYIWPLSELIKHPLDPLIPHIKDVLIIYSQYISLPIILISLIGLIFSRKNIIKQKIFSLLVIWWVLPLAINLSIAKVFTARYILFTLPPLIVILSIGIYYFYLNFRKLIKNHIYPLLLVSIFFSLNLYWIYRISVLPFSTMLPPTERGYISDWTSGWGIKNAADYLKTRALINNVIVGTEGYFGTLPDGLQIYCDSIPRLTIFGVGLDLTSIPLKLIDARNFGDEVYLLVNRSRHKLTPIEQDKLTLIKSYSKPDNDQLLLYRLK